MRRGWSCRRSQEAAAVFLFGKSGDGACGACQTEKIWYNGAGESCRGDAPQKETL